jgi:hypothetical protein
LGRAAVLISINAGRALMGTKAEGRFDFIQERAEFASTEMLDV